VVGDQDCQWCAYAARTSARGRVRVRSPTSQLPDTGYDRDRDPAGDIMTLVSLPRPEQEADES
jgi:hypothetical protein